MSFNTSSSRRAVILALAIAGFALMVAFVATSSVAFGVAGIAAWTGLLIAVLLGVRHRVGVALASLDRVSSALEGLRSEQVHLQQRIEADGERSRRFHMRSMERMGFLGKEHLARLDGLAAGLAILSSEQATLSGRFDEERQSNSRFRTRVHDKLGSQARDSRESQAGLRAMLEQIMQQHREVGDASVAARRAIIDIEALVLRAFADLSESLDAVRIESNTRLDEQDERSTQANLAVAALDDKLSDLAKQTSEIGTGLQNGVFAKKVEAGISRLETDIRSSGERMASLLELEAKVRGERLDSVQSEVALRAGEVIRDVAEVRSRLDDLVPSLGGLEKVQAKVDALFARSEELHEKDGQALQTLLRRGADWLRYEIVQEVEALHRLRDRLAVGDGAPLLGGWAIDPATMLHLVNHVLEHRPKLIVECGSGASTVWLARALEAAGGGALVALEHDPVYAERTRQSLARHNVDAFAEVRLAPIAQVDVAGEAFPWYSDATEGLDAIDMLLVDGPPKRLGPLARYPALPLLAERLQEGALVIVDDWDREDERRMVQRWRQRFGKLGKGVSLPGNRTMYCTWSAANEAT